MQIGELDLKTLLGIQGGDRAPITSKNHATNPTSPQPRFLLHDPYRISVYGVKWEMEVYLGFPRLLGAREKQGFGGRRSACQVCKPLGLSD